MRRFRKNRDTPRTNEESRDTRRERQRHYQAGQDRNRGNRHEDNQAEIVFGAEPIRELVAAAPALVRVLYVRAGDERRFETEIGRARAAGARIENVQPEMLSRLAGSDARHQGIIAAIREYPYVAFENLIAEGHDPLIVADGVTDPRNLGALIRSAEGAGARAIVIGRDRSAGITPVVIKTSAGAWVHMKIARCGNVARALEELKQAGYWIVALAPGGATSLYNLDASRKLAIVFGSEGAGVREIIRKTADFVVSIPMRGRVESLNVSVAAAVALFEIARRREAH